MGRALLPFVGSVFLSACTFPAYVPEKVTADGLLAISRGMTYDEVEAVVGPPLCVVSIDDARLSEADMTLARALVADCGPLKRTTVSVPAKLRNAAELSLSYAEPRESFTDPNIYLTFKAGHVVSVYIKKDDLGICCMDGLPTSPFYWVGSRELLRELIGRSQRWRRLWFARASTRRPWDGTRPSALASTGGFELRQLATFHSCKYRWLRAPANNATCSSRSFVGQDFRLRSSLDVRPHATGSQAS